MKSVRQHINAIEKVKESLVSTPDHRLSNTAIPSFTAFLEQIQQYKNIRDCADIWKQKMASRLVPQTLNKCYNTIVAVIAEVEKRSLIAREWTASERKLPKLAANNDQVGYLAYENFHNWIISNKIEAIRVNEFLLYRIWLDTGSNRNASIEYEQLCGFWNLEVRKAFSKFPVAPTSPSGGKILYGLPFENWSKAQINQFEVYISKVRADHDLLKTEDDSLTHVTEDTIEQYRAKIGRYLGFISLYQPKQRMNRLTDLLSDECMVKNYLNWHIKHCSKGEVREFHKDFLWISSRILLANGIQEPTPQMTVLAKSLRPVAANPFDELDTPDFQKLAEVSEQALYDADALLDEIRSDSSDIRRHSAAFKYGELLLFALLTWRPLRGKNFREMKLNHNLVNQNGKWLLQFAENETKNRLAVQIEWPARLTSHLTVYLNEIRPLLAADGDDTVFFDKTGKALTKDTWTSLVKRQGYRYFNKSIKPHAFRRWMTTSYLVHNPGDYETCRALLGHKCINTTLKYYAFALSRDSSKKAARFVEESCKSLDKIAAWTPQVP